MTEYFWHLKLLTFQLGNLCVTLLIEMVAKIVSGGPVDMALLPGKTYFLEMSIDKI